MDNGSEFINHHLFDYCVANKITFTRSRASHSNDGAHVEQKNWTHVRELVGYHRYDTATTPHQRAIAREDMRKMPIIRMNAEFKRVHPAAQSRQILALTGRLETLALAKKPAAVKPPVNSARNV